MLLWSGPWITDFLILSVTFWTVLYLYVTRKFNYWKERSVPYITPIPFFGNAFDIFTFRKSIGEVCRQLYESTTDPFVGFFICDEPYLLIRDTELVKAVLVKDFAAFSNRTISDNKKDDPMGSHILFILKTPDWRDIRKKITPVFTSGKMRWMYKLVQEAGRELADYLKKEAAKNPVVDIKEISAKYTTEAITSTSFGINANCFKNENAEFRLVSRRVLNWGHWERAISTVCYFIAPNLVKLFKLKFVDTASAEFLRDAFWRTMKERERTSFVRNDLLDILIEMKKKEEIDDPYKLEGDKLVAQATQFFMAGFETSSSAISFTLYELAVNPDIQKKLREEIISVKNKHGEFSYEALKEMRYLDMCVKETLRKYPILPFLDRRCDEDYLLPGTDVLLPKGTPVFISTWGLHFDPRYFPDPEKYEPARFAEENVQTRPQFAYLPFGEGPRNCIGARFGNVSTKSGVAHIISEFEVELCKETQHPIKLDSKGFLLAPVLQLLLKFNKTEKSVYLSEMWLTPYLPVDTLILLSTLIFLLCKYVSRNFDHWKKKKVFYFEPIPFFGNFLDLSLFRTTIGEYLAKLYNQTEEPFFGIFIFDTPHLIIRSPELIKAILVKDFNNFDDRNIASAPHESVTSNMLFLNKNPEWKPVRAKMTPVFTTGKLKGMIPLINEVGETMKEYIKQNMTNLSLEAKEICAKYSTDIIAKCAFAINANSFKSDDAEFRKVGRLVFDFRWSTAIQQTSFFFLPSLVRLFRMTFIDPKATNFLRETFWNAIKLRQERSHKATDVIDAIIDMKDNKEFCKNNKFEGDKVVAQAAQFFLAGFETTSSTIAFTLYELCLQPPIQHKVKNEIKSSLEEHGGITYEAIQSMKYLHMCVC
ncbi:cytochrome P450 6k1, partial [Asbolus verrucosus]